MPAFKKKRERFLVEEVVKLLGVSWYLGDDREQPDFLVTEDGKKFGLELTEVFAGAVSHAGSTMKLLEANRHKRIETLRQTYETIHDVPLRVQFVGNFCEKYLDRVVDALVAADFPSKAIAQRVVIEVGNGFRIHAMKALRPEWVNIMDGVGFVDCHPEHKIANAIKCKAQILPKYRSSAGADVRLLIIADRFQNSGKLALKSDAAFNLFGFQKVYFYSRPESVTELRST